MKLPAPKCQRLACGKRIVRRAHESENQYRKKKFCSLTCSTRCSAWAMKGRGKVVE